MLAYNQINEFLVILKSSKNAINYIHRKVRDSVLFTGLTIIKS